MINNENNESGKEAKSKTIDDSGIKDLAKGRVESHILIRDVDTKEVIVNKRGRHVFKIVNVKIV